MGQVPNVLNCIELWWGALTTLSASSVSKCELAVTTAGGESLRRVDDRDVVFGSLG